MESNLTSSLTKVLSMLGLMMAVAVPRASAFTVADFSGRYSCLGANNFNIVSAVLTYSPDGTGHYLIGGLRAALTGFTGGGTTTPSKTTFCNYALDTTASFYKVNADGTGYETLVWAPASSNSAACPSSGASFTDETSFAVSDNDNRADFTSANLLNQNEAGTGYCQR
jgi:hypothetical protein